MMYVNLYTLEKLNHYLKKRDEQWVLAKEDLNSEKIKKLFRTEDYSPLSKKQSDTVQKIVQNIESQGFIPIKELQKDEVYLDLNFKDLSEYDFEGHDLFSYAKLIGVIISESSLGQALHADLRRAYIFHKNTAARVICFCLDSLFIFISVIEHLCRLIVMRCFGLFLFHKESVKIFKDVLFFMTCNKGVFYKVYDIYIKHQVNQRLYYRELVLYFLYTLPLRFLFIASLISLPLFGVNLLSCSVLMLWFGQLCYSYGRVFYEKKGLIRDDILKMIGWSFITISLGLMFCALYTPNFVTLLHIAALANLASLNLIVLTVLSGLLFIPYLYFVISRSIVVAVKYMKFGRTDPSKRCCYVQPASCFASLCPYFVTRVSFESQDNIQELLVEKGYKRVA